MKRTLALAQINTRLGDIQANLEQHLSYGKEAKAAGAELLIFPELSLTGYALKDLASTVACRPNSEDPIFGPLLEASKEIDMVVGFVDVDDRHRFFIAGAYLSKGKVLHVHHKVYLPTYAIFDESRFFAWGDSIQAFDTPIRRMGIAICEDFWHASPPYLLWLDGAEILIFTSASPGHGLTNKPKLESARWVEHINQAYSGLFSCFAVHANRVGYEDGLHFWGGSTVYDPNGELLVKGPYHEEALITVEIDLDQLRRTRTRLPLLRDERTALVQRELARIVGEQG